VIIESLEFHGAGGYTVPEIFSWAVVFLFDSVEQVLTIFTLTGVSPTISEEALCDSPS